jgi:hypothetical protein
MLCVAYGSTLLQKIICERTYRESSVETLLYRCSAISAPFWLRLFFMCCLLTVTSYITDELERSSHSHDTTSLVRVIRTTVPFWI